MEFSNVSKSSELKEISNEQSPKFVAEFKKVFWKISDKDLNACVDISFVCSLALDNVLQQKI